MAEYVLLDMSGRERSKLVSILDYEWISIRHTKDARTADTSQFWFCENETNVKVIQEVMGHADVSTTMNIYAEANPEVTREALEKLAKNMDVF